MIRNRLALQMVFGGILFVAVSLWLYLPVRGWFHEHVAMPLRVQERVIVINPRVPAAAVQRGDVVAYRIPASRYRNIFVREGEGLGPVWAMPEDVVAFGDGTVSVNGKARPLSASRKEWGRLTVPEDCWFIWPDLDIVNRGVAAGWVEHTLRELALVPQRQMVGRPYGWWFFRAQGST